MVTDNGRWSDCRAASVVSSDRGRDAELRSEQRQCAEIDIVDDRACNLIVPSPECVMATLVLAGTGAGVNGRSTFCCFSSAAAGAYFAEFGATASTPKLGRETLKTAGSHAWRSAVRGLVRNRPSCKTATSSAPAIGMFMSPSMATTWRLRDPVGVDPQERHRFGVELRASPADRWLVPGRRHRGPNRRHEPVAGVGLERLPREPPRRRVFLLSWPCRPAVSPGTARPGSARRPVCRGVVRLERTALAADCRVCVCVSQPKVSLTLVVAHSS